MLESIKVTERLHWPELELSKKYPLSPMDEPVSPSQVCLEMLPCGLLKTLFTTSTSSYNMEGKPSSKHSKPFRKAKRPPRCGSSVLRKEHHRLTGAPLSQAGPKGCGNRQQAHVLSAAGFPGGSRLARDLAVTGSTPGLFPRVQPRTICLPTKLPLLAKGGAAHHRKNTVKKLCILTAIKPCNVDREKSKFFQSNFTYNPQFEYSSPVSPVVLASYSNASNKFMTQAVRIMELALEKYGTYENFEQATGGNLLSKSRIWYHIKKYMEKEGCVGEIMVHLTEDLLSRASMTVVNSRPTLTINVAAAREQWLEGMLRHEIGTHYLRGINNSQQPWSNSTDRDKLGLQPLNPTEEGLASIHSVLFRQDPTLWRAALLYYTVHQASRLSFSQLYHCLGRFVQDPSTRWEYCVRAKRGQTDTAQPGCFSKDQVYLEGILKILRHREKIDFPLLMALGKVSYEDIDWLKGLAMMDHVRIPHFLQDRARYMEQLDKIMEINRLTDEELQALI